MGDDLQLIAIADVAESFVDHDFVAVGVCDPDIAHGDGHVAFGEEVFDFMAGRLEGFEGKSAIGRELTISAHEVGEGGVLGWTEGLVAVGEGRFEEDVSIFEVVEFFEFFGGNGFGIFTFLVGGADRDESGAPFGLGRIEVIQGDWFGVFRGKNRGEGEDQGSNNG